MYIPTYTRESGRSYTLDVYIQQAGEGAMVHLLHSATVHCVDAASRRRSLARALKITVTNENRHFLISPTPGRDKLLRLHLARRASGW